MKYTTTRAELEAVIADLLEDELIQVHWLDACKTYNVSKLINPEFATYKKTDGRFWCIKEDSLYRRKHLIIKVKPVDYDTYNIVSIPFDCIVLVKKISPNYCFKAINIETGIPFLSSKKVILKPRKEGVGKKIE